MCVYLYIYIYIYTHTHIYTHMHMYVYIYIYIRGFMLRHNTLSNMSADAAMSEQAKISPVRSSRGLPKSHTSI